jgi:hypothetical protein
VEILIWNISDALLIAAIIRVMEIGFVFI